MAINDYRYVLIGGSTKCGTTSLFEYCAAHPQINGSLRKETRFFWNDIYPLRKVDVTHRDGIEKYDGLFRTGKESNIRLEASPDYMYSVGTADLIQQSLKDCRLIFVLREPIQRVISWYKFGKQMNLIEAGKSINAYVNELRRDDWNGAPQHMHAVEQGRYGQYLQPWYDRFGAARIHVGWYDELASDPRQFMRGVCRFAGVDSAFYDRYDFRVFNKSVNVKDAAGFNRYRALRRNLRRLLRSFPLASWIKSVLRPVDKAYRQRVSTEWDELKLDGAVFQALKDYYEADKELLARLTGQQVPW